MTDAEARHGKCWMGCCGFSAPTWPVQDLPRRQGSYQTRHWRS